MKKKFPIIIAMLALAFASCFSSGAPGKISYQTVDIEGNSKKSDFSSYKITIVNYWTTWCSPCVEEIPELQKLYEQEKGNGVNVVGVLLDGVASDGKPDQSAIDKAITILGDSGATYLNILPDSRMMDNEIKGMTYVPTTLICDSQGKAIKTLTGSRSLEDWKKELDEALAPSK